MQVHGCPCSLLYISTPPGRWCRVPGVDKYVYELLRGFLPALAAFPSVRARIDFSVSRSLAIFPQAVIIFCRVFWNRFLVAMHRPPAAVPAVVRYPAPPGFRSVFASMPCVSDTPGFDVSDIGLSSA